MIRMHRCEVHARIRSLVELLLKTIPGFAVAPPSDFPIRLDKRGFLHVLPQEIGYDGAFAARLRRIR